MKNTAIFFNTEAGVSLSDSEQMLLDQHNDTETRRLGEVVRSVTVLIGRGKNGYIADGEDWLLYATIEHLMNMTTTAKGVEKNVCKNISHATIYPSPSRRETRAGSALRLEELHA